MNETAVAVALDESASVLPAPRVFLEIPLEGLAPSPSNPRKTFDQVKLQELARSVAEVGVLEPLLVRALPFPGRNPPWTKDAKAKYEVVAGERRYRAAKIAEVASVPCIVRELTDVQVLEVQTVENLQRDDLHPLEEAEGYAALMKQAGYDVAAIAQKISKSEKYVYDRLKLLNLIPELGEVFLTGEISAGHAILLARLAPTAQRQALGNGRGGQTFHVSGLFQPQHGSNGDLGLEDAGQPATRKAVSVRELDKWINDHVRFKPSEVDLPNLFPETAAALAAAAEGELKVVKITRDYRVTDDARDEKERTYGRPSWKRADGESDSPDGYSKAKPSKTCEHSRLGVVVAGPGRGEAFRVCVDKKKCKVHWVAEMKEAEKRANGGGASTPRVDHTAQQRKYEEERRREDEERARWKKAAPKLLEALAEKLSATPALDLVDLVLERCKSGYGVPKLKQMDRGKTLEDAMRFGAFQILSSSLYGWNPMETAPKALKPYGIDARKIVDQVAPKPKAEKKKPEAPAKQKPSARARAAAKKRKVQTSGNQAGDAE